MSPSSVIAAPRLSRAAAAGGWAYLLVLAIGCAPAPTGTPHEPDPPVNRSDDGSALPRLESGELLPGGATTSTVMGRGAFVQQAPNLSVTRRAEFENGLQFFQLQWVAAPGFADTDGLGPTFNAATCLGCHPANGRGQVQVAPLPDTAGMLLRLGAEDGTPDPIYGDQLQPFAVAQVAAEALPYRIEHHEFHVTVNGRRVELVRPHYELEGLSYGPMDPDTRLSPRLAQQLVGLGLLEAIPEEELLTWEDPFDEDGDGISGRAAWLEREGAPVLGRFGWKASQPDVIWQAAAAFHGDLGITSPLFPNEDCPAPQTACRAAPHGGRPEISAERLRHTAAYVRLLAVPPRRNGSLPTIRKGKALFSEIGCDRCHRPTYLTGEAQEPELSFQRIWPYTDLLLHDLGERLADHRAEGDATGREWRTPPLWGLGLVETVNGELRLLHDGRARSIDEAILWHGGEATQSRLAYEALDASAREALEAFVLSL